mgnify:CR=1 FL=1
MVFIDHPEVVAHAVIRPEYRLFGARLVHVAHVVKRNGQIADSIIVTVHAQAQLGMLDRASTASRARGRKAYAGCTIGAHEDLRGRWPERMADDVFRAQLLFHSG